VLLTNGGDSAATKKKATLCLTKLAQGGGPVLGLFSPKDTATVNGYFKDKVRNLLSADSVMKFLWGKLTIIKGLKIKMLKR
jgi:SecD/SecF fusion protein